MREDFLQFLVEAKKKKKAAALAEKIPGVITKLVTQTISLLHDFRLAKKNSGKKLLAHRLLSL